MEYSFRSPIGIILLTGDGTFLTSLRIFTGGSAPSVNNCSREVFAAAERQITEYLSGLRKSFALPVKPSGTPFRLAVWEALRGVPYGETVTYGELARLCGHPRAARAVGTAMRLNPLPIIIPCHRVVASGGPGGYSYGLDMKRFLLELEKNN